MCNCKFWSCFSPEVEAHEKEFRCTSASVITPLIVRWNKLTFFSMWSGILTLLVCCLLDMVVHHLPCRHSGVLKRTNNFPNEIAHANFQQIFNMEKSKVECIARIWIKLLAQLHHSSPCYCIFAACFGLLRNKTHPTIAKNESWKVKNSEN